MANQFELFRLSLLPREQRDLLEGKDPTREEYLRKVFGEEYKFDYYKITYHYVPAESSSPDALLGRIGRNIVIEENLPPEKGLGEILHRGWKAAVIVIDPRHHGDGQKLAMEVDKQVGASMTLLSALTHAINNANPHSPYVIEPAPIVDAETFWDFERENKGNITTLSFEFVTPNMFGAHDEISEELRAMKQYEHAHRVKIMMTNSEGLKTDTDRVRDSVDYAAKGGGKISARAKGDKHYKSTGKIKSVILPDSDGEEQEHILIRAARKITEILGR